VGREEKQKEPGIERKKGPITKSGAKQWGEKEIKDLDNYDL